MIRLLFRLIVLLFVLGGILLLMSGWRPGQPLPSSVTLARPAQVPTIDTTKAREVGAEIGTKAAAAASQAQTALADGSITAKIKAKMALDDMVRAREIHVDFTKGVVTLTGTVSSQAERRRVVQLAAETSGVTSVKDRMLQAER